MRVVRLFIKILTVVAFSKKVTQICNYHAANPNKKITIPKIWNYWLKEQPQSNWKICILPGLPSFYLKIWLSKVKCYVPFLLKKRLKRNYKQEFLKCTFLPAELERGTEVLQFDVCCKAVDQNLDCGCDRCAILHLDSLIMDPIPCDPQCSWAKLLKCISFGKTHSPNLYSGRLTFN